MKMSVCFSLVLERWLVLYSYSTSASIPVTYKILLFNALTCYNILSVMIEIKLDFEQLLVAFFSPVFRLQYIHVISQVNIQVSLLLTLLPDIFIGIIFG